jgi:hypothetical protein
VGKFPYKNYTGMSLSELGCNAIQYNKFNSLIRYGVYKKRKHSIME